MVFAQMTRHPVCSSVFGRSHNLVFVLGQTHQSVQNRNVASTGPNSASTDLYKLLGVKSTATLPEVKAAYFKLSKKYHPDVNSSPDAVEVSSARMLNNF